MTPEATIGLLHMLDHWKLMLMQMQGQPLPELPAQRGRVIAAPKPPTPEEDAAERDVELQAAAVWRALASDNEGADLD